MGFDVKILADSVNEAGNRLTTFELTYPRFVHAQLMTHRLFSRNAASSRAIPTKRLLERIEDDPAMPLHWGRNQRGMQAREELDAHTRNHAEDLWILARDSAVHYAREMATLGVHKQIVNRLVEPWMFITVIVSATEFDNWYHLRTEDAQPEIAWVAGEMAKQAEESEPEILLPGDWHLPLVETRDWMSDLFVERYELPEDDPMMELVKISTARCARVSYLTHDGKRDIEADIALHDRLRASGHWSPFEHAAMAMATDYRYGNFFGFKQYRKFFTDEHFGKEMD